MLWPNIVCFFPMSKSTQLKIGCVSGNSSSWWKKKTCRDKGSYCSDQKDSIVISVKINQSHQRTLMVFLWISAHNGQFKMAIPGLLNSLIGLEIWPQQQCSHAYHEISYDVSMKVNLSAQYLWKWPAGYILSWKIKSN